jgi:hypothetical protein
MLKLELELENHFNDDHRISSSNSPGSPTTGNGSSGRDRNTISTAAVGDTGGLRRDIDSHELGRNDSKRRKDNERQKEKWDRDQLREHLRFIALSTVQTLDEGEYFPPGQDGPYDLKMKILRTNENTRYYGPSAGEGGEILGSEFIKINEERNKDGDTGAREEAKFAGFLNETRQGGNESEKATAAAAATNLKNQTRVQSIAPTPQKRTTLDNTHTPIFVGEYSTLVGARKVYLELARNTDPSVNKKIGILNFASAKRPGGGFIVGCQAQVRFFYYLPYFSYMIIT